MLATAIKNSNDIPNFKEYLWYKSHEEALLVQYYGRFVVIKDEAVIADYAAKSSAWRATIKSHPPGTFIIHHCYPTSEKKMRRLTNHQLIAING
jgi:hypothetical protein